MKLLSILTLCAALCVAVTQASSQVQEEEDNIASLKELLKALADQANIETVDTDELATAEEYARSNAVNDNEANAQWRVRIPRIRIPPIRIPIPPIRIPTLPIRIPTIPFRIPTKPAVGRWKKEWVHVTLNVYIQL